MSLFGVGCCQFHFNAQRLRMDDPYAGYETSDTVSAAKEDEENSALKAAERSSGTAPGNTVLCYQYQTYQGNLCFHHYSQFRQELPRPTVRVCWPCC